MSLLLTSEKKQEHRGFMTSKSHLKSGPTVNSLHDGEGRLDVFGLFSCAQEITEDLKCKCQ